MSDFDRLGVREPLGAEQDRNNAFFARGMQRGVQDTIARLTSDEAVEVAYRTWCETPGGDARIALRRVLAAVASSLAAEPTTDPEED